MSVVRMLLPPAADAAAAPAAAAAADWSYRNHNTAPSA